MSAALNCGSRPSIPVTMVRPLPPDALAAPPLALARPLARAGTSILLGPAPAPLAVC
jgi:hypothetical protein